jgi:alpha-1,2-mannosyltransferase
MQSLSVPPAPSSSRRARLALAIAGLAFMVSLAVYLIEVKTHTLGFMLTWYDLHVYNRGGLVAVHYPRMLYVWKNIKFTYTPFAALVFGATSAVPWATLKVLTTITSVAALLVTVWLTFGGLGWAGRRRVIATLSLFAVGFWTEPVQRALHLGQIELWLMLLIVWDMTLDDRHKWKGIGIGVAAGIKMVPLIFIPYLILAGKLRQAAVATAMFFGSVLIGFIFLPAASSKFWLTGYFLNAGNVGGANSLLNQSLLGVILRAEHGSVPHATPVWIAVALVVGLLGLAAGAILHRSGQPVAGWVACAITGLLISPISWDHHWLWVVPVLAVLIDAGVRRRGGLRSAWWVMAGLVIVVYQAWPRYFLGRAAWLPDGLLGYIPRANQYGFAWVNMNLFVFGGLAMFAVVLAAAISTWRAGRAKPGHPDGPANLPAPTPAGQTG